MSFTNQQNIALPIAAWLADDTYDHSKDPYEISVTSLIKPIKVLILSSRVAPEDAVQDLSGLFKSRMGTALHDAIETTWTSGRYKEALKKLGYPKRVIERIKVNPKPEEIGEDDIPIFLEQRSKKKVGKWTISGKYDIVLNGQVQDIKSTSAFGYHKDNKIADFKKQASLYRWLNSDIIQDDFVGIHYLITDYSAGQDYREGYPPHATPTVNYELASVNEVNSFVHRRVADIERLWNADESEMERCNEDDLWLDPPKFKYYKDPAKKTRSTKNFDDMGSAIRYKNEKGKGAGVIDTVYGEVKACRYCPAFYACKQKDEYLATGQLKV